MSAQLSEIGSLQKIQKIVTELLSSGSTHLTVLDLFKLNLFCTCLFLFVRKRNNRVKIVPLNYFLYFDVVHHHEKNVKKGKKYYTLS